MRFSSRLVVCAVLTATSLALAVAVAVKSQTQSIAGETMLSENGNPAGATAPNSLDIVAQCDSSQLNGTVNYTVSGVAAGPYGGTYSESGYFVLEDGDVTAYQASFTITPTGGGSITGTKNRIAGGATGTCSSPVGGEATAEVSGVFSYTANVNGTSNTGTGGMSLDIHDGTETVAAVGHAHSSFYGDGKTTGGGHILKAGSNKGVHFGFNAQLKNNGTLDANGVIQDHNNDNRIKILTATSYVSNGTSTTFSGECEFNGTPQQYEITVSDVDEPGRGVDSFSVTVGSYTRSGILTGGNIQVRGVAVVNPPTTPTPPPTATPTPTPTPD